MFEQFGSGRMTEGGKSREMMDASKVKTHPDYRVADTYRLEILGQDYVL